jgi:hypothetical protein
MAGLGHAFNNPDPGISYGMKLLDVRSPRLAPDGLIMCGYAATLANSPIALQVMQRGYAKLWRVHQEVIKGKDYGEPGIMGRVQVKNGRVNWRILSIESRNRVDIILVLGNLHFRNDG